MACKPDTFREIRRTFDSGLRWRPGLRLEPVVNGLWMAIGLVVSIPVTVVYVYYLDSRLENYTAHSVLLDYFLLALVLLVSPAAGGFFRRFRLLGDAGEDLTGNERPRLWFTLLREVAKSDSLMSRLNPPHPEAARKSGVAGAIPGLGGAMPLYYLLTGLAILAFCFMLFLLHPIGRNDLPMIGATAIWVGGPLLLVSLVSRRMRRGVRLLGSGCAGSLEEDAPCRFEDVESVALEWDRLLAVPYLRLTLQGKTIRYYSMESDPLHLLRVAKFRLPHLTLTI